MEHDLDRTALLVVDVQVGMEDPWWGPRNNPECEPNIARLIAAWRAAGRPLVFVRHDSVNPDSPLRPGPSISRPTVEAPSPPTRLPG